MSKEHIESLVIEDDLNERYVACLLLYAEAEGIDVSEAHEDVSAFLKEYELDVHRTNLPYTKKNKAKFH